MNSTYFYENGVVQTTSEEFSFGDWLESSICYGILLQDLNDPILFSVFLYCYQDYLQSIVDTFFI